MSFIGNWQKILPIRTYSDLYAYQFSAESPTYMFIPTYTFINFCTFLWPILTSDGLRSHFEATIGNLNQQLINCKRSFYWNSKQTCNTWHICEVSDSYTLLNATKKIPPILLFRPIRLLIFCEKSHLYVYSHLYFY